MDKLTALETALLKEFESLASEFATLAEASKSTDQQLITLSDHFSGQISTLAARQTALEERLSKVTEALNRQTASSEALLTSVNRLMAAQSR